jgi:hypothetical protein
MGLKEKVLPKRKLLKGCEDHYLQASQVSAYCVGVCSFF